MRFVDRLDARGRSLFGKDERLHGRRFRRAAQQAQGAGTVQIPMERMGEQGCARCRAGLPADPLLIPIVN